MVAITSKIVFKVFVILYTFFSFLCSLSFPGSFCRCPWLSGSLNGCVDLRKAQLFGRLENFNFLLFKFGEFFFGNFDALHVFKVNHFSICFTRRQLVMLPVPSFFAFLSKFLDKCYSAFPIIVAIIKSHYEKSYYKKLSYA